MNRSDERTLMYNIGCGDMRAMKHLMDRYLEIVSRSSFRIMLDRKDSEAVTQDVFVHAWNYPEQFDGDISLEMWLLRLTDRYSRLRLLRRKLMYIFGEQPDLFVTASPQAPSYDDYVTKQAWGLYCRASVKLSARQRVLFTFCMLEQLSLTDVSVITGISRRRIVYLLSGAETKIKKELRHYGKADEYARYVGFLRMMADGLVERDKLKRIILASIR